MSDISYLPLIEDMTWSFSRVSTYDDCPHQWFLKYIRRRKEDDRFYACYGSFMHKLLDQYYHGTLTKNEMLIRFLSDFSKEVRGLRPSEDIVAKYIEYGANYLRNFTPIPIDIIATEKKMEFEIDGVPFVGYIDLIGKKDGEIYIVDHKSRDLNPRSNRQKPTAKDRELDEMLKQLYIYSVAVEKEYGAMPSYLCFNCFKNGSFIKEQFDVNAYEAAKNWAVDSVRKIKQAEDFEPSPSYFKCRYLCGVNYDCVYDIEQLEERGRGMR